MLKACVPEEMAFDINGKEQAGLGPTSECSCFKTSAIKLVNENHVKHEVVHAKKLRKNHHALS